MTSSKKGKAGTLSPAELKALLPPAPILSTESAERFDKVFDQLIATLEPQDMVEVILIWDFAVPNWEINRYTYHRTLSFDRGFRQNLEFQVERVKNQKAKHLELAKNLAPHLAQGPADIAQLRFLESKIESADKEMIEISKRTPSERDHSHALEKTISFHKDVEFLTVSLTKRRNEALQMLDLYRAGLGNRVGEAMREILEADYDVVDSLPQSGGTPSLVPPTNPDETNPHTPANQVADRPAETVAAATGPVQENNNDLGTPNSSEPAKQSPE